MMDTKQDITLYNTSGSSPLTLTWQDVKSKVISSDIRIYCHGAKTSPKDPRVSGSFQITIGTREADV
jgi:hypothetical protein